MKHQHKMYNGIEETNQLDEKRNWYVGKEEKSIPIRKQIFVKKPN